MASLLEREIELSLLKGQLQFVHVKFDRLAAERQTRPSLYFQRAKPDFPC